MKTLLGHLHWVNSVRYNPSHDQLLISGGTEGVVNLWRMSSISSAPLLDNANTRIKGFEEDDLDEEQDEEDQWKGEKSGFDGGNNNEENESTEVADIKVKSFTEQEETISTSALTWCATSPFVFASAAYDGRMVINYVPHAERYKILL